MARRAKTLQPAKVQAIAETKALLEQYGDYIFADYRGLTVLQLTQLRHALRGKQSGMKVIKNNLADLAFKELQIDQVSTLLTGPTAVVLVKEDTNEIAKILFDFAKESPALQIKGGWLDGELYDGAKLEAFAKLPGKKQLIAMLMSTINGPIQKLAATLQAYVDQKSAGGDKPAAAPEPEAAPAPSEPAPAVEAAPAEAPAA
jgi:large subunit ribosomal protein L10